MKKIITCLVLVFIMYHSYGQDKSKIKEVGLTVGSGANFGIHFKTGNEKTLFRLILNSDYGASSKSERESEPEKYNQNSGGIGLNLGFERRKVIIEKCKLYYGLDLVNYYDRNSSEAPDQNYTSLNWSLSTGIGIPVGLIYDINNLITLSAGIMPSILYNYAENVYETNTQHVFEKGQGFSYSLISQGANIAFSFRFGKKD